MSTASEAGALLSGAAASESPELLENAQCLEEPARDEREDAHDYGADNCPAHGCDRKPGRGEPVDGQDLGAERARDPCDQQEQSAIDDERDKSEGDYVKRKRNDLDYRRDDGLNQAEHGGNR